MEEQDIGWAVRLLKQGKRVARQGWNGRGMWLALSPGHVNLPADKFWAGPNREYAAQNGGSANVLPSVTMKTASGEILMGWLASQSDLLADDWVEVTWSPPQAHATKNDDPPVTPSRECQAGRAVSALHTAPPIARRWFATMASSIAVPFDLSSVRRGKPPLCTHSVKRYPTQGDRINRQG